jgi:hypothetical protein
LTAARLRIRRRGRLAGRTGQHASSESERVEASKPAVSDRPNQQPAPERQLEVVEQSLLFRGVTSTRCWPVRCALLAADGQATERTHRELLVALFTGRTRWRTCRGHSDLGRTARSSTCSSRRRRASQRGGARETVGAGGRRGSQRRRRLVDARSRAAEPDHRPDPELQSPIIVRMREFNETYEQDRRFVLARTLSSISAFEIDSRSLAAPRPTTSGRLRKSSPTT